MIEIVIFSISPALFLLWYFYHKDRIEPEPKIYVLAVFLFGATVSPLISTILSLPFAFSIYAPVFIAPIFEEASKLLAVYIPYKRGQMDGVMDGVVYGVAAGLGFATTENIIYGLSFGENVVLLRAIFTPIAHATFTAVSAVGLGLMAEKKVNTVLPFLVTAIVLHSIWNFFALIYFPFNAVLLVLNILLLRKLAEIGLREDMEKIDYYLSR
ncbi:conserved hypothetical protein [Ferroglobus placidus DSM 10642]|uniref:Protease PrsW n=1 Tax=Ferroglobus placidus (strain DSM 10642 / AEDII12DO) TaxID=589924 RepID=D3S1X4_FERPA|nr:PrsW family glutamic-type intramembrane protease [Ferroglobus placidus]ADC64431.1 conserved hypothetical protein [Ferroglobus placidus DSM 10642]